MPQDPPPNPFRPDPSPRFILSIPFTTPEIPKAPIILPLFNLRLTPNHCVPTVLDRLQAEQRGHQHYPVIPPQASFSPKTESSQAATPLDSGSFYLSAGSVASVHNHGDRRHSSSDDVREQLFTPDDERSDEGRSKLTSYRDKSRQESPSTPALSDHSSDPQSEQPLPQAPVHNDAPVMLAGNAMPAMHVYNPDRFYAHPQLRRIRLVGSFRWYRSEGNEPIQSPPARSPFDIRDPFVEADVVVHEALPSNVVQVWCWDNGSWLPIKQGYKRKIFGKFYTFDFGINDYKPCWLSDDTIKRRALAKK